MKELSGKVAVVTGASSGIGRGLAYELAKRGSRLALSDVNEAGLDETVQRCKALGAQVNGYVLDVADREAVQLHADTVVGDFGRVNLVINNAGVTTTSSFLDTKWEDFDWVIGVDFWGVVHGTKAFLPYLVASGDGHLVNISSVFGLFSVPQQSSYNAAKFAVRGFTESVRQELILEGHPVSVSCVHPGGIRTNIVNNARHASVQDGKSIATQFNRVARTSPEKAAKTILSGVLKNKPKILIGPDAHLMNAGTLLLGRHFNTISLAVSKRFFK